MIGSWAAGTRRGTPETDAEKHQREKTASCAGSIVRMQHFRQYSIGIWRPQIM